MKMIWRKTFLFSYEADHKTLIWGMPSVFPAGRNIRTSKDEGMQRAIWTNRPYYFSHLLHLALTLSPILYFHDFLFFIIPSIKTHFQPPIWAFISFWKLSCDIKLTLNIFFKYFFFLLPGYKARTKMVRVKYIYCPPRVLTPEK